MVTCGSSYDAELFTEELIEYHQITEPETNFEITFDIVTFRAEVLEMDSPRAERNPHALLVQSMTPFVGDVGERYIVRINTHTMVIDVCGTYISYADILPGTIVDITTTATAFLMRPAITGADVIRVVE